MNVIDKLVQYVPIEEEECKVERSFDNDVMDLTQHESTMMTVMK